MEKRYCNKHFPGGTGPVTLLPICREFGVGLVTPGPTERKWALVTKNHASLLRDKMEETLTVKEKLS